jgi:3-methylfumaryl-CoA hydratase
MPGEGEVDPSAWVGRTEDATDVLGLTPARALAATLDLGEPLDVGAVLPPLWHWLYLLPLAPTSTLGPDGHPSRGGFLPPIDLERRMWAGGRLRFERDLHLGEEVRRRSRIEAVTPKEGKAGPMVFVRVWHEVSTPAGIAIEEEQDIVYVHKPDLFRSPPADPLPPVAWEHEVPIDPVLLFRFSALTFNAHRIHYDAPYSTQVEHYPGLVVHGPLQAVLLMQAARRHRPAGRPASFSFRASRPLFGSQPCTVAGVRSSDGGDELFTANPDRDVAMRAQVTWA